VTNNDQPKNKINFRAIKKLTKQKENNDQISVGDFVSSMGESGFGLLLLFFALAIIIPTPPPFPSIISIPLVIFGYQMLIGAKYPLLPKKISNYQLKRQTIALLVKKSTTIIYQVEKILKPRLSFMFYEISEKFTGGFILLFSSFILLPIPLSNYVPGIGILLISFGILAKDGFVILLGIIIGFIGVLISIYASMFIIYKILPWLIEFYNSAHAYFINILS
jgi:hypothetical protein